MQNLNSSELISELYWETLFRQLYWIPQHYGGETEGPTARVRESDGVQETRPGVYRQIQVHVYFLHEAIKRKTLHENSVKVMSELQDGRKKEVL